MNIIIRPNPIPVFKPLWTPPAGTWLIINVGGRGGGKSYEVSKYSIVKAVQESKRCALLRDQQSTIAQSIMHEIKMRYDTLNIKSKGFYDSRYEMQDKGLKDRQSGTQLIFSKGFRTQSNTQKAALKSVADVDIAIIEEFEDITDESKFNVFADSIRKEGALIIINSNVPHKNHWFIKRYFNLEQSEYEGYYRLIPKNLEGVVYIFSTYADNPHLPFKTIERYRAYGDPESPFYNPEHYCTDILGLVSEGARGRIYKGWKHITKAFFKSLPYPSYYGLDFGYADDPVALVEIKSHNNRNFYHEIIYETGLTNPALAKLMSDRGVPKDALVFADSAEPKSIQELNDLGYKNVQPADKGQDSIDFGIKAIQALENYATEESKNLWMENEEYKWRLNDDGESTGKPVDKKNHLKDGLRMANTTYKQLKRKTGKIKVADTRIEEITNPLDWL